MSKRVKWSIAGAAALAVALVAVGAGFKSRGKAVEVRIEPVSRRDLVASVTASGQVRPRSKVDVSADITGRITRLAVKEGQIVSRGQFLLQIDPAQAEAAVQRAEAALASARAQAAQARANFIQSERNHQRSAEIRKANPQLVSDEQLEQLRTAVEVNKALLESADHTVEQSQASLRDARSSLSKTTIVAPMPGRVTRLNVEQGETAIMGTLNKDAATLLTVSDMSVLETRVKVDETDVARISIGDSAQVQIDAFPDTTFIGRVVEISNSSVKSTAAVATGATDQAVDYEVTIELLNAPNETRPDFSATAKIVTDTRPAALSIPIIALTVRENEDVESGDTIVTLAKAAPTKQVGKKDVEGVFVIGADEKVTFRPVRVGIAGERYFEVVSGLRENERIVAGTYQAIRELKDGALVKEAKEKDKDGKKVAKT
ncbi:MAG TPA: efflux RND transporter periplasmic adaptor subunit [Gemmatimonadaceae bacterium]|nr:efflux RND transporter periplasmic adaptor subunit [Gemmatimonadaceae bacterium]